jgi:hypothetical protein
MRYLSSVYSVTIHLHVSGLLVAHHQEVTMYICDSWYVLYVLGDCWWARMEWKTYNTYQLLHICIVTSWFFFMFQSTVGGPADSQLRCLLNCQTCTCLGHINSPSLGGRMYMCGTVCVNQTLPHCVNPMGKTQPKSLAARHGRGTVWARHGNGIVCVN